MGFWAKCLEVFKKYLKCVACYTWLVVILSAGFLCILSIVSIDDYKELYSFVVSSIPLFLLGFIVCVLSVSYMKHREQGWGISVLSDDHRISELERNFAYLLDEKVDASDLGYKDMVGVLFPICFFLWLVFYLVSLEVALSGFSLSSFGVEEVVVRLFYFVVAFAISLKFLDLLVRSFFKGEIMASIYAPMQKSIKGYFFIKLSVLLIPYLFCGLFFSGLYVVQGLKFDSEIDGVFDAIYFSFVTLTTLGYGDIHPDSWDTKLLVITESIIGVIYLSVVIGVSLGYGLSLRDSINRLDNSEITEHPDNIQPEQGLVIESTELESSSHQK